MIVLNYLKNYYISNTFFLIIIIINWILIEKLCPIIKIFISKFYNNLKIMSKVVVITVFKNKIYTKIIVSITHYLLNYNKLLK